MDWKNRELIRNAWQKTKLNLWMILAIELLVYLFNFLGRAAGIGFIASLFTGFIMVSVFLRISRDKAVSMSNLFEDMSGAKVIHYLAAMIIVSVFIGIGIFLFVIPGIMIGIMTIFTAYIVIDMNQDKAISGRAFWDAIKKSVEISKGLKWKIFKFILCLIVLNFVGLVALVVGLLVTIPISGIALAMLYDKLRSVSIVEPISNIVEAVPSQVVS